MIGSVWYFIIMGLVFVGLIVAWLQIRKKQREDD